MMTSIQLWVYTYFKEIYFLPMNIDILIDDIDALFTSLSVVIAVESIVSMVMGILSS